MDEDLNVVAEFELFWQHESDFVASLSNLIREMEKGGHVASCKPWEHGYVKL